jgi:hypothetical protein
MTDNFHTLATLAAQAPDAIPDWFVGPDTGAPTTPKPPSIDMSDAVRHASVYIARDARQPTGHELPRIPPSGASDEQIAYNIAYARVPDDDIAYAASNYATTGQAVREALETWRDHHRRLTRYRADYAHWEIEAQISRYFAWRLFYAKQLARCLEHGPPLAFGDLEHHEYVQRRNPTAAS